ncbi:hypothetical protein PL81_39555 [Streptomyces sp. RSD-27]|nr:hypothetical protein PL81_39555 [Streptomyces sp. RSD-27]
MAGSGEGAGARTAPAGRFAGMAVSGGGNRLGADVAAVCSRRASWSLCPLVRGSRAKRSSMIWLSRASGMIFWPERYSLHTLRLRP